MSGQDGKVVDKLKNVVHRIKQPWRGSAHPLEIQRAILQQLETDVVAVGGRKKVFPYTHLHVWLLAETPEERAVLRASFGDGKDLSNAIREHLAKLDCPVPNLAVELTLSSKKSDRFADQRFAIEKTRQRRPTRDADVALTSPVVAKFTVVKGKAERKTYSLDQDQITLGRLREVVDEHGRLLRVNDIAFADDDDDSRSVSREHAHIERRGDELRLIEERSAGGTRIFRAGRSIAVSSRDRRGIRLESEDLIYLGRAALQITLREKTPESKEENG